MVQEIPVEGVLLKPGLGEDFFEKFVLEEYYLMSRLSGEEGYLFKGVQEIPTMDRLREGIYMLCVTYENRAIRQERTSADGNKSKEMKSWLSSSSVLTNCREV